MIISEEDALWAANEFIDYFKRFKTIEDYLLYSNSLSLIEQLIKEIREGNLKESLNTIQDIVPEWKKSKNILDTLNLI